jgi:hypothetical protein
VCERERERERGRERERERERERGRERWADVPVVLSQLLQLCPQLQLDLDT